MDLEFTSRVVERARLERVSWLTNALLSLGVAGSRDWGPIVAEYANPRCVELAVRDDGDTDTHTALARIAAGRLQERVTVHSDCAGWRGFVGRHPISQVC